MKDVILGKEITVMVGTIPVSCADSISLDITAAELSTLCIGSGDIETFRPGKKTIKGTIKGLTKLVTTLEAPTNFTFDDFVDGILDDTLLTIHFTSTVTGEIRYTLSAYSTSFKIDASVSDVSKYDVSFRANSITRTTVPA